MKTLMLFTLLCVAFIVTRAQITPSACIGPALLYKTYQRDVKKMAADYINAKKLPDTIQVDPPQAYLDTIYKALSAVYNMKNRQADTLFNMFCLHSDIAYKQFLIDVYVDGSPWTNYWQSYQITTGVGPLDDLLARYNFSVYKFSNGGGFRWATLITDSVMNMQALADSLENISGITYAYQTGWPSIMVPERTYVTFSRDTVSRLDFMLNWGYSNQYSQTWSYKIDNNCNVTLLSSVKRTYDQPDLYAEPINCNLFPLEVGNVKQGDAQIYPNPAKDYINISGLEMPLKVAVVNLYGEIMFEFNMNSKQPMDISTLIPGIYIVTLSNREGKQMLKLFKE